MRVGLGSYRVELFRQEILPAIGTHQDGHGSGATGVVPFIFLLKRIHGRHRQASIKPIARVTG
jgi:hypothetical protein